MGIHAAVCVLRGQQIVDHERAEVAIGFITRGAGREHPSAFDGRVFVGERVELHQPRSGGVGLIVEPGRATDPPDHGNIAEVCDVRQARNETIGDIFVRLLVQRFGERVFGLV